MILKARKKPVVVEAVQWTGENWNEIKKFAGRYVRKYGETLKFNGELPLKMFVGDFLVREDWIIRMYDPDIFNQTYEIVKEDEK